MRKISILLSLIVLALSSCIKNEQTIFTGNQIEWDATSWNPNSAPFAFPIMTRVPIYDFATPTTAPTITRNTTQVVLRVNLIGAQRSTPTNFSYRVATDAVPASFGEAAVAGTNYTALSGTGQIPANSSFGFVTVPILNPGVSSTTPRVLILELTGGENLTVAVNYSKIGLSINQN